MTGHVLRVIDFETTGMEPPAAVIEVGVCDLTQLADGAWEVGEPTSWLCGGVETMPPEVQAVHHISFLDVQHAAPFDRQDVFAGTPTPAAIAAHNYEFEHRFLGDHGLPSICTLKAAYRVWPEAPGHSNQTLRYWLEGRGLLSLDDAKAMPPHRAGPDAYVTAHLLLVMLRETTAAQMVAWTKEPLVFHRWAFGKHKDQTLAETPADYLRWVVKRSDLDDDVKWNCRRELDRRAA